MGLSVSARMPREPQKRLSCVDWDEVVVAAERKAFVTRAPAALQMVHSSVALRLIFSTDCLYQEQAVDLIPDLAPEVERAKRVAQVPQKL